MSGKTRKQLVLLGALIAVFVAVMFVRSRGEGQAVFPAAPSNQAGRGAGAQAPAQVADVRLESLKDAPEARSEPQRNLFAFRQRAAPAPPTPRETPTAAAPVAPVPTGPPPPPPIQLKFIGILDSPAAGGKVAILSDGRGNTFHAREGQEIDGRYTVIRIGTESIELSYVDGRGRQTLRLSGQ